MNNYDNVIDALFQALPTNSFEEILRNLTRLGFTLSDTQLRDVIAFLRRNSEKYGWTVAHVGAEPKIYQAVLLDKDGTYHTDPAFKASALNGSIKMSRRVVTESGNHGAILRAISEATHISKPHREKLTDLADDWDYITKKTKKILRQVEEEEADGTNGQ